MNGGQLRGRAVDKSCAMASWIRFGAKYLEMLEEIGKYSIKMQILELTDNGW